MANTKQEVINISIQIWNASEESHKNEDQPVNHAVTTTSHDVHQSYSRSSQTIIVFVVVVIRRIIILHTLDGGIPNWTR